MRVGHAKPGSHGEAAESSPLPKFCDQCDKKVRFEDRGKTVTYGANENTPPGKQLQVEHAQKHRLPRPPDGAESSGELPALVAARESPAQPRALKDLGSSHRGLGIRLRGKLKWLFEQDRMFQESNSGKSSRQPSPDNDTSLSKSSNASTSYHATEENCTGVGSSKKLPVEKPKPPRKGTGDRVMISREEGSFTKFLPISIPAKEVPGTSSSSPGKIWPCGKTTAQNSKNILDGEGKVPCLKIMPSFGDQRRLIKANESPTVSMRGGEEICSVYEDAPKSGESSDVMSSDDEEFQEEMRKKVADVIAGGTSRRLQEVKSQAALLKAKCELLSEEKDHALVKCEILSKEKDNALREWEKGCLEIDQAQKMAQALRTAIETLLDASSSDSRANFNSRKFILEDQTQALKRRIDRLRRKGNSEGQSMVEAPRLLEAPDEKPTPSLEDRVETLKQSTASQTLACRLEIPRDTDYKIEVLRGRLEKLMLATNSSRISHDQGQTQRSASRDENKPVEYLLPQKAHLDEKAELKMKGWYNSLRLAGSTSCEGSPARGSCESKCREVSAELKFMASPSTKPATPSISRQENYELSEETKENVFHRIAQEVQLEAEQWYQVQELIGRVGDDMKSLQEACSTWERRAIESEAKVELMRERGEQLGSALVSLAKFP